MQRQNAAARSCRASAAGWFARMRCPPTLAEMPTVLDTSGPSARPIADQLGHAGISMTQDVYMGRRAVGSEAVAALEAHNPDGVRASWSPPARGHGHWALPGGSDRVDVATQHRLR